MMPGKRLDLNLASHPLRNRRFFYLLFTVFAVLILLLSFFAGKIYIDYRYRVHDIRASIKKTDQLERDAKKEEEKFSTLVENATEKYGDKIDLINAIILKKSFSWIEFLSDLEKSLPDSSYITSLAPTLTKDSQMQLKFNVASQGLDDLLTFIQNLKDLKFYHIRISSESRSEDGFLLSEISLTYDKNV